MLYREIIAVCSQIHTKHINTLCAQNVELLNAKTSHCKHSGAQYFEISHHAKMNRGTSGEACNTQGQFACTL